MAERPRVLCASYGLQHGRTTSMSICARKSQGAVASRGIKSCYQACQRDPTDNRLPSFSAQLCNGRLQHDLALCPGCRRAAPAPHKLRGWRQRQQPERMHHCMSGTLPWDIPILVEYSPFSTDHLPTRELRCYRDGAARSFRVQDYTFRFYQHAGFWMYEKHSS